MDNDDYIIETPPTLIDQSMSPDIGKLAGDLAKAQAEMGSAQKDAENPFFKSSYATLDAVIKASKPLHNHGISYTQMPGNDGEMVTITTLLMHSSGQWIRSTVGVRPSKADAQGYGSVLSYLRRYCLSAVCGIAQSDDDGNAGSQLKGEMNNSTVDIQKLDSIVAEAIVIVDECDDDLESGARRARELYEGLVNDERIYVNGQLQKRKFKNESTGRENGYWPAFKKHLLHAAETT